MSRIKRAQIAGAGAAAAAFLTLATSTVGRFEGLRLATYRDVVGIPTVCYGETRGIRMEQTFTKPQCDAMLLKGLDEFATKMEACTRRPMPDATYVAFLSLGWNIGTGGLCGSTAMRRWNAGDREGACNAFLMWNRAGPRVVPGLTARRVQERALCLKGA